MSWQTSLQPVTSVMPLVDAHRTTRGMRLVNRTGRNVAGFVIRIVVGLLFLLMGTTMAMPGLVFGTPLPVVMGVVMVIGGIAMLISAGAWVYRRTTLQDAHLDLPRLPLRLGEAAVVRFSQRRAGRAPIRSLSARLICQEWVRSRQGSTTRTDTHEIWSQPLPAEPSDPVGRGIQLRGTWHLRIPPGLPPSFTLPDNAVQWLVTVQAEVTGRPDIINTFTLPVLPEVVSDFR